MAAMKKFFVAITTAWNDELLQCHKTVIGKKYGRWRNKMKKKYLTAIMAVVAAATVAIGCGKEATVTEAEPAPANQEEVSKTEASADEYVEEQEEEAQSVQSAEDSQSIHSAADNDQNAESADDDDQITKPSDDGAQTTQADQATQTTDDTQSTQAADTTQPTQPAGNNSQTSQEAQPASDASQAAQPGGNDDQTTQVTDNTQSTQPAGINGQTTQPPAQTANTATNPAGRYHYNHPEAANMTLSDIDLMVAPYLGDDGQWHWREDSALWDEDWNTRYQEAVDKGWDIPW